MRSIHEIPAAMARNIHTVLTDIDDTLTTDGRLPACAYSALESLENAGLRIGVVTGRPAGWCDMIARFWPVAGVIGENGGLCYSYERKAKRMRRIYSRSEDFRAEDVQRLARIRDKILTAVPGARVSADQAFRVSDLAIDFCEDGESLSETETSRIQEIFAEHGAQAKVSSIHVNGWFGDHDKLSMTRRFVDEFLGLDLERERERFLYCGDSPNDAPMFAFFPHACGVANIAEFRGRIGAEPTWIARRRGGQGFAEIAHRILAARL